MDHSEPWLDWAVELQSIAQAGLYYGKDRFDRERYQRVREIAAQMLSHKTGISPEKVRDLFCCETGYQTPKLDTRAAIFQGETILLVQETDGRWSLPGGWVDAGLSVKENTIKEVREEAGKNTIFPFMPIKSVKYLSFAPFWAGILPPTWRPPPAAGSPWTPCPLWRRKKTPGNRWRCASTPTTIPDGSRCLTENRAGATEPARFF